MSWRDLCTVATIVVALVAQLCGGIGNTYSEICPKPIWSSLTVNTPVKLSLRVQRVGNHCVATFPGIDDDPQVTWCDVLSSPSDSHLVVLKLPGCGDSTYISSQNKDNAVADDRSAFSDFNNDHRLWKVVSCTTETPGSSFDTFYQTKDIDDGRTTYTLLTVSNGKLTIIESIKNKNEIQPTCSESAFTIKMYPKGIPAYPKCYDEILDEVHQSVNYRNRKGKRHVEESLGRLLRLMFTIGDDKYVLVRKRYENGTFLNEVQIENLEPGSLSSESLFYYVKYLETDSNGKFYERPDETAFTLLHGLSRQYLTVDVTRNSLLNVGDGLTGLTFQDAEQFPDSPIMDYRHFKVYKKQVGSGGVKAIFVCSIHFRSFCFLPARSGALRLYPVDGGNKTGKPTFKDPSDATFAAFSTMYGFVAGSQSSQRVPTFGVYERSPVAAWGAPEVVFISEYSSSSGGAQESGQRRVLSYDSTSNRILLTSRDQALQSPFRIARQKWTESGSSSVYISLSVVTRSQPLFSLSGLWITRYSSSPVRINSPFKTVDLDDRLFSTKCCLCSQSQSDIQSVFYNKGGKVSYLSIAHNGTLILRELPILPASSCLDNALKITTL